MTGGVVTGFAPAAGVTLVTPGAGSADAATTADGASPLDAFGELLASVTGGQPAAETQLGPAAAKDQVVVGVQSTGAHPATDTSAVVTADVTYTVPAANLVAETPDVADLITDLVEALAALDTAIQSGEPVDPKLEQRLSDSIDAVAEALDIPVEDLTVDPMAALAAAVPTLVPRPTSGDVPAPGLDALAAIGGAPVPTAHDAAAPVLPISGDAAPVTPTNAAGPAATDPVVPPLGMEGETAPEAQKPVDPASPLGRLIEKFEDLAAELKPLSPALADKLASLAQQLRAGAVPAEKLAALGLDPNLEMGDEELKQVIEALLAHKLPPVETVLPKTFAAPDLKLPEVMAMAAAPKPEAPASTAPAPAKEPLPEAPRLELSGRKPSPVDDVAKPDALDRPAARDTSPAQRAADAPPSAAEAKATQQVAAAAATVTTTPSAVAVETKAIHAAYRAPVQQINFPQVAFEMVRQVQSGASRFQIRLDPPELGRIDVRMEVDNSGNVNARMTVERAETLDLMQRDHRALERALAQAGLDTSKTNLEFSLRQNPFGGRDGWGDAQQQQQQHRGGGGGDGLLHAGADAAGESQIIAYRGQVSADGVNLVV